jgi:hypothetical protein
MRASSVGRFFPWAGRAVVCLLLVVGVYFAARQFVATIERVGAPSAVAMLAASDAVAPQAVRRAEDVCSAGLEQARTADALRYCGMIGLVDLPGATPSEQADRYRQSVEFLKASLDRSPFNGATWLYLAVAMQAMGDRANAAEAFDTSYEVDAIAAGMAGMRVSIGLGMLDALKPITLWSLDAEIQSLGRRNIRYLHGLARTPGQLQYVATTLMVDPPLFARFMREVNAPPPGVARR